MKVLAPNFGGKMPTKLQLTNTGVALPLVQPVELALKLFGHSNTKPSTGRRGVALGLPT